MTKSAYSIAEAAVEIGCGERSIRDALTGGYMVGHRNGTKWIVLHSDLIDWVVSLPSEPLRRL
jgi:hypothetical protein